MGSSSDWSKDWGQCQDQVFRRENNNGDDNSNVAGNGLEETSGEPCVKETIVRQTSETEDNIAHRTRKSERNSVSSVPEKDETKT